MFAQVCVKTNYSAYTSGSEKKELSSLYGNDTLIESSFFSYGNINQTVCKVIYFRQECFKNNRFVFDVYHYIPYSYTYLYICEHYK